jgi:hypothetical protein
VKTQKFGKGSLSHLSQNLAHTPSCNDSEAQVQNITAKVADPVILDLLQLFNPGYQPVIQLGSVFPMQHPEQELQNGPHRVRRRHYFECSSSSIVFR